ncbi:hypothetical protein CASFOL_022438 [Castilleja foliolosa]|uniref:Sodium/calcium exchanger membrane region domain-containing protein n=1 Tax=Castilleja foliolosa TaxID=1961234 RepID=A0ABD3CWI8_9LAMI
MASAKIVRDPASISYLNQREAAEIDEILMGPLGFSVDQLMELAGLSVATSIAESASFVSAISESRKKKLQITFLTMSEIYGTVVMNNILGLIVLISLVYFRNLTWTFSAEVLIVLIVSAIVGSFASFNTVYPVWTSILAYFLYPLSLALVYILGHFDI